MIEIHVTDRNTFKTCRTKYDLQVRQRLGPKIQDVNALYIGSAGHAALQGYYEAMKENDFLHPMFALGDWLKKQTSQLDPENLEMMTYILEGYVTKWYETDKKWKIIGIELPLSAKIPGHDDVYLRGTVDLLIQDEKGYLWIVDHKFLRSVREGLSSQLEMDDQMTGYIWLLRQNGYPVQGCIYDIIRKKTPTIPEQLKNGGFSKNKSIDTTAEVYTQAVVNAGLNLADYQEFIDEIAKRQNLSNFAFYWREPIRRNKSELDMFEADLYYEALDMVSTPRYYPTPGQQCGWCQFKTLCKAQREGSDVEYLKSQLYEIRPPRQR